MDSDREWLLCAKESEWWWKITLMPETKCSMEPTTPINILCWNLLKRKELQNKMHSYQISTFYHSNKNSKDTAIFSLLQLSFTGITMLKLLITQEGKWS